MALGSAAPAVRIRRRCDTNTNFDYNQGSLNIMARREEPQRSAINGGRRRVLWVRPGLLVVRDLRYRRGGYRRTRSPGRQRRGRAEAACPQVSSLLEHGYHRQRRLRALVAAATGAAEG